MIPPVKQEALPMVAIAPTPATSHSKAQTAEQQAADNQTEVALEITRQPPETFYKDQYGRKATFDMVVKRSANCCAQCEGQRLLSVQLLYENGKAVEKQGVLHVASGLCLNQNKESTIAIRIAEVSKNHLNQRFRLEIAVPPCPGVCALKTSVVSNPVLVMSKTKKRHVKRDGETESPAKMKKAKSVQSIAEGTPTKQPDSSIDTLSAYSTLTGRVAVAIAGMGESGPPISASEIAPFALDTPNLCLWANAAFDLLRKLQWQRLPAPSTDMPGANLDEILTQALSRAYKCPSCHEIYGDIPSHREDCDLKLLLEQGQTASPTNAAQAEDGEYTESHPLPWSSDKPNFSWTEPMRAGMYSGGCVTPKAQGSPCNLTQDLLQVSEPGNGDAQETHISIPANTLNPRSWKAYATLSKLIHSSGDFEEKSSQVGTDVSSTVQWTGLLPPVGTLSSGFSTLPSAFKSPKIRQSGDPPSMPFQRFSSLLSVSKTMSPDVANLLREGEAALNGEGNITNSLSNLSLSELLRNPGNDLRLPQLSSSLSALLGGGDSPTAAPENVEKTVHIIAASDFRDCGFPAFDASYKLLGFYCLLDATHDSPTELRFMPNLYALPEEMLRELEITVTEWKKSPSIIQTRRPSEGNTDESLTRLKNAVLHRIAHQSMM